LIASQREASLPDFQAAAERLDSRGWPVYVRKTGGTVCPMDQGVLNLSVVNRLTSSRTPSIGGTYLDFCSKLINTFSAFGIACDIGPVKNCYCNGNYNIRVSGRKLAGTSQRWVVTANGNKDNAVLMHATILVDTDRKELCRMVNLFNTLTRQDTVASHKSLINFSELVKSAVNEGLMNTLLAKIADSFNTPVKMDG
jgi:lipoate-protein ligase A